LLWVVVCCLLFVVLLLCFGCCLLYGAAHCFFDVHRRRLDNPIGQANWQGVTPKQNGVAVLLN
jgi:hypothetical protein